jgi:hypothetical protein
MENGDNTVTSVTVKLEDEEFVISLVELKRYFEQGILVLL